MDIQHPTLAAKVRLHRIEQGKRELLGFAELTIGGAFVIKDIAIARAKREEDEPGQPFVSFPAKKGKDGDKYYSIAHPITAEARKQAVDIVLKAFEEEVERKH